jgi:hypothetical protein
MFKKKGAMLLMSDTHMNYIEFRRTVSNPGMSFVSLYEAENLLHNP